MNYSEVKATLNSLCSNNGWTYGVFWRFDPRNSMLLTMEDAYFEEKMRHVLDSMLLQVHLLGEGIIGESAFTGKHQWMHADTEKCCPNQFFSGIQTVAIIPVEHRGVLQFGSVKKIMESVEFLKEARKSFQDRSYSNPSHSTLNVPSSSSIEYYDVNELFASLLSQGHSNHSKHIQSNNNFHYNDLLRNTIDPSPCISEVYHAREASAYEDVSQIFTNPSMEGPCINSWSTEGSILTSFEPPLTSQGPSNVFDKKRSFEDLINSTDPVADISDSCLSDDLPPWFNLDLVNSECIADDYVANLLAKQASDNSERDPFAFTDSVYSGNEALPHKGLFSELGLEELLRGEVSCTTSNLASKELLPKSQVGLWMDDIYSISARGSSSKAQRRSEEPSKATNKRARPRESTRPRPKDRQLIQDRLKELRGIIPNSSKCSIDSLLDKTIKHMIFLQNITQHSDKLKKANECKGTMLKDDNTGGTTWAFEVGNQSMGCPIMVEDLASPGQMQIEMLCEEKGLFLEIADIVRGFGLNILKGTMEVREGKIWSHFVVEATRQVTRMDVLWSLVQLLQQTDVPGVDLIKSNINNNNLIDGGILPCSGSSSYKQSVLPLPIS